MKTLYLALCIVIYAPGAYAASFDCNKATTLVEKAVCSDDELSFLDDCLTDHYKRALEVLSDTDDLKSKQKTWLKNVRNKCQDVECLKRVYNERVATLMKIRASASPASPGITGYYQVGENDVKIHQISKDHIKFQIYAIYKMNTGDVLGEASLNGDTAVYVNNEDDCGLIFKFLPGKVIVTQNGLCAMGLNVNASGEYKHISSNIPKFESY